MEKMSAEEYAGFIQKLAGEIVESIDADTADDYSEEEIIAKRAFDAYESAQLVKEAAEADYDQACAYEDAALQILDELDQEY